MSINPASVNHSTMNVGVVIVNNKPYLATLHFRDSEGNTRPITEQMKRTSDVSLKLFQDVLNKFQPDEHSLIQRVSSKGFQLEGTLIPHSTLKSADEWQKFITHLERPVSVEEPEVEEPEELQESAIRIEFEELEEVDLRLLEGEDLKKLAEKLYEEINKARQNHEEFPKLTDKEKLFLKEVSFFKNYPKLLAGQFDDRDDDRGEMQQLWLEF